MKSLPLKLPKSLDYFGHLIKPWQCPTLTWGNPTLPSALNGFTSEFEMGSGGARVLCSPGKSFSDIVPLVGICHSWLILNIF